MLILWLASSFTDNHGLCGIPGLRTCGPHFTGGAKIGIAFGVLGVFLLIIICSICCWKRRQNILRTQQMAGKYIDIGRSSKMQLHKIVIIIRTEN